MVLVRKMMCGIVILIYTTEETGLSGIRAECGR
jgi:hypothetical protein